MFNICRIAMTDQFHLKIELQVAIIGFKVFCNKEKEAAKIKATSKNNQVSDITKVSKINSASLIVYIGMRSTIITQPASFQ